jgi:hypothetical protein
MATLNVPLQSMLHRGNNGNVKQQVKVINNLSNQQIIAACKAAQQATGRPVYLVGAISSLNLHGAKVSLPHNWHYRLRLTFKAVASQMLNAHVWACNPAAIGVFGRHIKAAKALIAKTPLWRGPQMLGTTAKAHGNLMGGKGKYTFSCLQRANKNYARCACAIILVNAPLALNSNGVQMELKFALKYNPNAKVYQWQQPIGPMANLVNLNLNQLSKLGCTIIK